MAPDTVPLPEHRAQDSLVAGLDHVGAAPRDRGTVDMIVRRPALGEREVVEQAELTPAEGLVGDNWRARGSRHTPDGAAEPGRQLTLMSSRAIALFAGDRSRWPLAGDQLLVDFDLAEDHLPPGARLRVGAALLEVSAAPHTGCVKFTRHFGAAATRLTLAPAGRRLRLRGLNASVLEAGRVSVGDVIERLPDRPR